MAPRLGLAWRVLCSRDKSTRGRTRLKQRLQYIAVNRKRDYSYNFRNLAEWELEEESKQFRNEGIQCASMNGFDQGAPWRQGCYTSKSERASVVFDGAATCLS
jgi:hypothetical protein